MSISFPNSNKVKEDFANSVARYIEENFGPALDALDVECEACIENDAMNPELDSSERAALGYVYRWLEDNVGKHGIDHFEVTRAVGAIKRILDRL